ncbi:MAG: hypothetical protein OHK0029_33140 [Armatimonadaceae bacterium]
MTDEPTTSAAVSEDDTTAAIPPPAYFLSLTVQNFRCFGNEPQTLDLSDGNGRPAQWTILLGENGTGKTTLLQSVAALQPVQDSEREQEYGLHPRQFSEYRSFLFTRLQSQAEAVFHAEVGSFDEAPDKQKVGFTVLGGNGIARTSQRDYVPIGCFSENLCVGYGANRRMSNRALSESRSDDSCLTLFESNAELLNAEDWLAQNDYAARLANGDQHNQAKHRLESIKTLLMEILPDVSDFRFTVSDTRAMTPQVEAKTPYGWVRVRDLSLGYQAALTWMVDFASRLFERYPNSENPLAEPAICLVDEIDLHLHPRWQRQLMETLTRTFPKTQFIVTAHSPLIVQAAPNANLALLRREGDHVVIENDVDYIRNWRVDQILTSDLFLNTAVHAPEVEQLLTERTELMSKPQLTPQDRERIAELDRQLGDLPTATAPEDREAMDIIRRAAALLRPKVEETVNQK